MKSGWSPLSLTSWGLPAVPELPLQSPLAPPSPVQARGDKHQLITNTLPLVKKHSSRCDPTPVSSVQSGVTLVSAPYQACKHAKPHSPALVSPSSAAWDDATSHFMVWFLQLFSAGPEAGFDDPCGCLPTQDILWFYDFFLLPPARKADIYSNSHGHVCNPRAWPEPFLDKGWSLLCGLFIAGLPPFINPT